ncbi:MAG: beta-N-acetylhexosaminidase [Chloroflexota bacterium]|nr:beta-N-acetylhexosaminidase [Chloroflexota bacterium]
MRHVGLATLARIQVTIGILLSGSPAFSPGVGRQAPDEEALLALRDQMSLQDKVGQLFLLGFPGTTPDGAVPAIAELRAGGIVFLDNAAGATEARGLTADLQQVAQANGVQKLLFAIDQEGGSVQRLRAGVTSFSPNWDTGHLPPATALSQVCQQATTQAGQLADVGIQVNLAPVVDVVDNPANTVIGERSYSADPTIAAHLGAAYIAAFQSTGGGAVAKHFPGHGSTTEDSHQTLPIDAHDRTWMDAHELVPFRAAIQANVDAVMVAHVAYPALDPVPDRPASLSPVIIDGLLRNELGFTGLVMTDDLGAMRAVTDRYESGEAAIQAVAAGADQLIVSGTLGRQRNMVAAVADAVGTRIDPAQLDAAVLHVLRLKQKLGLLGDASPAPSPPACAT